MLLCNRGFAMQILFPILTCYQTVNPHSTKGCTELMVSSASMDSSWNLLWLLLLISIIRKIKPIIFLGLKVMGDWGIVDIPKQHNTVPHLHFQLSSWKWHPHAVGCSRISLKLCEKITSFGGKCPRASLNTMMSLPVIQPEMMSWCVGYHFSSVVLSFPID